MNPPIGLTLHNHLFIWNSIGKMTRLRSLTVYGGNSNLVRFNEGLNIQSLHLYWYKNLGAASFAEIAKLKNLRWLQIRNGNRVTLDEVRPLANLENVTFIGLSNVTQEAEMFLDEICAKNERSTTQN